VGDDALATVLGSSPATIRGRRREGGVLTSRESDGLYRLASTLARAVDALGSQEAAREWLLEPQRGLGGREPIGLLSTTPGQNAVFQLLGRIEHGVYT
jgi:putative toxin-antitoxin system antitoxin component (TIGR02293 family)